MKTYLIVWILSLLNYVEATVYYSNEIRKTYYEAEEFCNRTDGKLLRYGGLFNEVVSMCGENLIQVWTGTPWYIIQKNCITEPLGYILPIEIDNSTSGVAVCADHCAHENFTIFAVQINECQCYDDNIYALTPSGFNCVQQKCTGNKFDMCGRNVVGGTLHYTVYTKEKSLSGNTCPVRKYANKSSDGEEVRVECSSENLTFICQVGSTEEIQCSRDAVLQTSTEKTSSEPKSSETEQTSTDETTTSVDFKPSETTFYSFSPLSTNPSTQEIPVASVNGIIIGVVVAVGILAIIVVVIVFVFVRKRRSESPKPKKTKEAQGVKSSNIPFYSEVVPEIERNKINDSKPSDNSNVTKAVHSNEKQAAKLITSQNEENHYTVNPEGVYDSAGQHPSKLTNADTNLYNVNPEGVYDSASQHPAKPSNTDTNIYNVNSEEVYDSAAHHSAKQTETDIDNIYDHQLDDTYDVSTHKTVQDNPDIYDQTVIS